ncbi:Hypothetical protein FKW44_020256, partial [Caligus rogercresseyi]
MTSIKLCELRHIWNSSSLPLINNVLKRRNLKIKDKQACQSFQNPLLTLQKN